MSIYLSTKEKSYLIKLIEKDKIINEANIVGQKNIALSETFGSKEAEQAYEKRVEELLISIKLLSKITIRE